MGEPQDAKSQTHPLALRNLGAPLKKPKNFENFENRNFSNFGTKVPFFDRSRGGFLKISEFSKNSKFFQFFFTFPGHARARLKVGSPTVASRARATLIALAELP